MWLAAVDNYYPFGLTFNQQTREGIHPQNYLYNGKELQDDLGFDVLDYGARFYQPDIGRFFTQDRFAEKYFGVSPYHYSANSPINSIDINGDSIWFTIQYNKQKEITGVTMNVTGKVLNGSSDDVDMDNAVSDLASGITDSFQGTIKVNGREVSFKSNVKLSEAKSMKDVLKSDHLFVLADVSGKKGTARGASDIGGKISYIDADDFSDNGSIANYFGWSNTRTGVHELGHLAWLTHKGSGLMKTGGGRTTLASWQLQAIFNHRKSLNDGSNSIGGDVWGAKTPNPFVRDENGVIYNINQLGIRIKLKKL